MYTYVYYVRVLRTCTTYVYYVRVLRTCTTYVSTCTQATEGQRATKKTSISAIDAVAAKFGGKLTTSLQQHSRHGGSAYQGVAHKFEQNMAALHQGTHMLISMRARKQTEPDLMRPFGRHQLMTPVVAEVVAAPNHFNHVRERLLLLRTLVHSSPTTSRIHTRSPQNDGHLLEHGYLA